MSVRESIDRNPRAALIAAGIVVLLAFGLIAWQMFPESSAGATGAYYSDDDGKTYFVDAVDRIPPFDHGGKPAVKAVVMARADGGEPFVAYLLRYSESGFAKITAAKAQADAAAKAPPGGEVIRPQVPLGDPRLMEVKKPGTGPWIAKTAADAAAITAPKAPDGSDAVTVEP